MDTSMILPILSSSVLAALITAIVSKQIQDNSNKLKYVTEERQKWRKELREAAVELRRIGKNEKWDGFKTVAEAKTFFQIRLNPRDLEDRKLLNMIKEQEWEQEEKISAENLDKLSEAISWLLKHDWERVKQETSTTRLTSIYYYIIVASGIYLLLCINGEVFIPEMFETVVNYLKIDTYRVRSISMLCLPVLLIVPLLLLILNRKWRQYKDRLTNSNRGCGKYFREILDIPFRKRIKTQENKNGKNN